jgi:hypothetical protein
MGIIDRQIKKRLKSGKTRLVTKYDVWWAIVVVISGIGVAVIGTVSFNLEDKELLKFMGFCLLPLFILEVFVKKYTSKRNKR